MQDLQHLSSSCYDKERKVQGMIFSKLSPFKFHALDLMENLRTAISLALVARKHIAIYTDDYEGCVTAFKDNLLRTLAYEDLIEIDLLECHKYDDLVSRMVKLREGHMPELYQVIIWKNLERLSVDLNIKSDLLRVFNELERYDTLASKNLETEPPIQFGNYMVRIPEISIIIPILVSGEIFPKFHRQLKEKLWFCQSYLHSYNQEILATEVSYNDVIQARERLNSVYANAEIKEYVCSLMVFTRSHRLCSLAPLTTRPSLKASQDILLLAKALVVWANREEISKNFVTPDFVKIAYRKIGYWLVDWETNDVFTHAGSSHQKRTEISLLTGDWYGSEWPCVEKYLNDFRARPDSNSSTGFSNLIVEDVLNSVSPPL